jgi:hypothetical protein
MMYSRDEDWLPLLVAYVTFGLPAYGLYKLGVWLEWWPVFVFHLR